ncbi:MAG: AraC family transcriptional regulator [Oceanospirillaceae bacterium]|uniref:helix-turn-helix transcriptional regulator n=1 Tax=unclassified Thalassolituus TaxID=2624967 RepID=UPI000C3B9E8D|nr:MULTISPECIES: helix-turn-helix transcriptional regulator [unclassified Thalassolituus]MAX98393.1 AraC family transcriptional regulator [Oceanospirillaceae bacterium]MBL34966.1 AraC family transcriptional regulator [Oceanospirillaceae bacterium]MBS54435.1 AraC family transcriptional regulator [Oceanospirillaceae bacterium]
MAFFKFSTLQFPDHERMMAAQDIYAAVANIELKPAKDSVPNIETMIRLLPGVSIGWVKTSPLIVDRKKKHIADGNDDLALLLNPLGNASWGTSIANQGDSIWSPGMGCISYNDLPGTISFQGQQTYMLNINLSRDMYGPLIARLKHGQSPITDKEVFNHLSRYALDLMRDDPQGEENPLEQTNQIVDLIALAIGAPRDYTVHARQNGLKQARMKAVKADINLHYFRGDMSVDWIARRHGISPSYVRAMFEREGTSFTDYVLNVRLKKAFDCLSDPLQAKRAVNDIAYSSGFNNSTWFYRAFKKHFGFSPGEARAG